MTTFERAIGQELPGFDFPWEEETAPKVWEPLNLTAGHTFAWNLRHGSTWRFVDGAGARQDKTTGVTGYDGGVRIEPGDGDCDVAVTGVWTIYVTAVETATGLDRVLDPAKRPTVLFSAA